MLYIYHLLMHSSTASKNLSHSLGNFSHTPVWLNRFKNGSLRTTAGTSQGYAREKGMRLKHGVYRLPLYLDTQHGNGCEWNNWGGEEEEGEGRARRERSGEGRDTLSRALCVSSQQEFCLLNHFLYNKHVARQLFLRLLFAYAFCMFAAI